MPRARPFTTCCSSISVMCMKGERWPGGGDPRPARSRPLLLGRDALVDELAVLVDLVQRHHPALDVAILIELDRALEGVLEARRLDGVADGRAVDCLPALRDALDRVGDHEHTVVGSDRVVLRLAVELG